MKWSSPLPRLDWWHTRFSFSWAWGLTLYGPSCTSSDLSLSLSLGYHEYMVGITWPERSRP